MESMPVLLLSGAGLPVWIWDDVRRALPVESRVATYPRGRSTLADHGRTTLEMVADWPSLHVVAHSVGGVVAAAMAALAPDRVTAVTGVCAVVPRGGSSFVASLPTPQRQVMGAMVRLLGTRPPERVLRSGLCRGLDDAVADRVVADFAPESRRLYLDRVGRHSWPGTTAYVATTADPEFPVALQERYAATLGAQPVTIDSGHLPMLERPAALAELLSQ